VGARRGTEWRGGGVLEGNGEPPVACVGVLPFVPADDVVESWPLVCGCVAWMEVWEDGPRRFGDNVGVRVAASWGQTTGRRGCVSPSEGRITVGGSPMSRSRSECSPKKRVLLLGPHDSTFIRTQFSFDFIHVLFLLGDFFPLHISR
jgi:hypothetical protein